MKKAGFIGTGTMGGALAAAVAGTLDGSEILLADSSRQAAGRLAERIPGAEVCDNRRAAAEAQYLFLGVKPQVLAEMLEEIAPVLAQRSDPFVLVSMAAGQKIGRVRELAGGDYPVIRILPNIPVSVGEGMIFVSPGEGVSEEAVQELCGLLSGAGKLARLPEKLIDAGSSVSSCGIAYACMFLEALADGGVACGLPRAQAMEFAAQMMAGTARLFQETGKHPGALKDMVCSPGGTTIEGVRALEESGFRAAVMDAVIESFEKNDRLGG